jgi:hypothetical protein
MGLSDLHKISELELYSLIADSISGSLLCFSKSFSLWGVIFNFFAKSFWDISSHSRIFLSKPSRLEPRTLAKTWIKDDFTFYNNFLLSNDRI